MIQILSICTGIGLSAACGFRVFVPLLLLSIGAKAGYMKPDPAFLWLASDAALITLSVATILEISAYYVPWLDNLLDSIASPAAVVAGILVSSSMITELHPMMKWSLSIIAGGGAAAAVQSMTVTSRLVSSLTTGGIANPVVSTTEAIFATILSIIAILLPIFALIITIYLCYRLLKLLDKRNSLTKTTVQLEN